MTVHHPTATVRGRTVAHRAAGDPAAPAATLIHDFLPRAFADRPAA
jgi:hypothetical protein